MSDTPRTDALNLERALADERAIVDRVWKALGISSYEGAHGKTIDQLVADAVAGRTRPPASPATKWIAHQYPALVTCGECGYALKFEAIGSGSQGQPAIGWCIGMECTRRNVRLLVRPIEITLAPEDDADRA